jgi:putative hydrolase
VADLSQPDDPDEPNGPSNPGIPGFPVIPGLDFSNVDMNELFRILQAPGPVNWEIATQIATAVATDGETEGPVAPSDQTQLEELARAAQTHVVAETGLAATFATPVRAMGRHEWADLHLNALRPVLESLATTLGQAFSPEAMRELMDQGLLDEGLLDQGLVDLDASLTDAPGGMPRPEELAAIMPMMAPLLLGVQSGSMIGYLARHALGRYDLPLPTADAPSLAFVVSNIDAFEEAWSLERTDLRFYVAIHEVVHAATRSVSWVRERLLTLATEYVSAYELDPTVLDSRLGDGVFENLDPSDPSSIQALAEHPEELLGALRSDRQRVLLERARVFHAVLEGYADAVLERVGRSLLPSFDRIHEAMARHRIERGEAERFVEGLLGLATDRDDYERGAAFCRGVVERAGSDGLNRLWENPAMEPTSNELVAPGLWLARIELDLDEGDAT